MKKLNMLLARSSIFAIFIVIVTSSVTFAATLDEAIYSAHKNADEIAIRALNVNLSEVEVSHALQKFLPEVKYSIDRGSGRMNTSIEGYGVTNYDVKNDSFTIKEDLSLHRLIPEYIVRQNTLKSDLAKYQLFLNDFTIRMVQNYVDIIIARENLALAKDLDISIASEEYNSTIKKIIGSINIIDFLGVESRYDDSQSRIIQAQMQVQQLEDLYALYTKTQPTSMNLPTKFLLPANNLNDYLAMVRTSNKSLEDIRSRMIVASSSKNAAYVDLFLPKASVEYADKKSIFAFFPGTPSFQQKQLVMSLEMDIYDKGEKVSNIAKASILKRMTERELQMAHDTLEIQAKTLWGSHHSLYLLHQAKRKELEVEQARLNIAKAKFAKKSISLVDLVQVKANFYNAKINYLNTYKEFVVNYYKLLGTL